MTDLHDGLSTWLASGARGDVPRDVAVHASGCDECQRLLAAYDALALVDPGAAPEPPTRTAPVPAPVPMPLRLARAAAAGLAVVLVIGAGAFAGGSFDPPRGGGQVADAPVTTPGEGILGGEGGPTLWPIATGEPTESPSPSAEPTESAGTEFTPAAAAATPKPAIGGGTPVSTPRPPVVGPPPPPPPPPPPATPVPTTAPTPTPIPTPTPVPPTPSPTLSQPTIAPPSLPSMP